MTGVPDSLLNSLEGIEGFDRDAFIRVHESNERVVSVRLNPAKPVPLPFDGMEKVPWSSKGYYLPARPSFIFDPLIHAGAYYVQEASSMFVEQCLVQLADMSRSLKVLDLCAAPGGKSTLVQSLINDNSLLVSNEVIKSRVNIVTENLSKWGGVNNIVTNNDPKDFARLEGYFDIMIVDAPCSGSGLFRRDPSAIEEWSEEAVEMCSMRQQRILTGAWPALKKNGLLIYSTCSYSRAEDEDICDWLCENFRAESLHVAVDEEWNIVQTSSSKHKAKGYRFFPDKLRGEGFFISCFRKKDGEDEFTGYPQKNRLTRLTQKERAIAETWLKNAGEYSLYLHDKEVFAFPVEMENDLTVVSANLYTKKAGFAVGKLLNNEMAPAHELALSVAVNKTLTTISLKKEEALQYLRKEEVTLETGMRGWALVQYEGLNLGWVKLLHNRINNYYPKEWRILKSANN